MAEKIKILWYSDFLKHTGFGNVAAEIISRLNATGDYEFKVIGINHDGSPYNYPESEYFQFKDIPVWPAASPLYEDTFFGFKRFNQFINTKEFDLLFIMQDAFNIIPLRDSILRARLEKNFKYIFYFPIDGDIKNEWVSDAISIADYPVAYSQFGVNQVNAFTQSIRLDIIPHGVDLNFFKPFEKEEDKNLFRKMYFNAEPDDFIISNINRNQPRKDLPRCMLAFSEFCKRHPDLKVKLYLHCLASDPAGHKIHDIARKYLSNMAMNKIISPDPNLMCTNGISTEKLGKVYAASNIITSTTLGEGWGLSTTEAMACRVPVVMPNNSALTEIIGEKEERGYLVKSGGKINAFHVHKYDNDIFRPLTDTEDLISKWEYVYDNYSEALKKADIALRWVQDYSWEKVVQQWDKLFKKAYKSKLNE